MGLGKRRGHRTEWPAWLEHGRGLVKRNMRYRCSREVLLTSTVVIAHTEPKAVSDFVQTIISVLLFDGETEECLGAVAMSLRGWKTKTCIEVVYSTSHLMTNPGHAKRATNGKTAPRGRQSGKNFMVIQGWPLDVAWLGLVIYLKMVVRSQTSLCISPLPPICLYSTTRPRLLSVSDSLPHPPTSMFYYELRDKI